MSKIVINKSAKNITGWVATYKTSSIGTERLVIVKDSEGNIIGQRDPFYPAGIPVDKKQQNKRIKKVIRDIISDYQRKQETKEKEPSIIFKEMPHEDMRGYYDDKTDTIYVSNKLSRSEANRVIKHEKEHRRQRDVGDLPVSKFVPADKSIKDFMHYLTDPKEITARAAETGESISAIFNEVFRLRDKSLTGTLDKDITPLIVKKIIPVEVGKWIPDRPFKNTHIEIYDGVEYEISNATGRLALTEWQEKRIFGKLTKNDPQPVYQKDKAIRIHFKGTGNGILAASQLRNMGIEADSNAPYTTDIPLTEENIQKMKEVSFKIEENKLID
ncbi:MAG: hypothetical protein DDT19_00770 [Syntrophomonadaceae bacterium]|nr:hypothetical protein [Bacillota bacterium]